MLATRRKYRGGLILLVVLSMLALFSLLSVTYLVYSSQSRSANMGFARREHHRPDPDRLLDSVVKQLLRGTGSQYSNGTISATRSRSAIGPHSLLGDIYGHREALNSTNVSYRARYSTQTDQAEFIGGGRRFLRVPLDTNLGNTYATVSDASGFLSGRVLTFMEGPLQNQSFRIVYSIGNLTGNQNQNIQAQSYSVVIDLNDVDVSGAANAAALVQANNQGYWLKINPREFNSHGLGVAFNSQGVDAHYYPDPNNMMVSNPLHVAFQQQLQALTVNSLEGDTDEPIDTPDYNDVWLSYRYQTGGGFQSQDIIPSFHRAAVINYIVNSENLTDTTTFTQSDFVEMLGYIERACSRPLGISVRGLDPMVFPNIPNYFSDNPNFTGGNAGFSSGGGYPEQIPTLDISLGGQWTNWTQGNPSPLEEFRSFVRFLTKGPWDVDNDGDGWPDSIWTDADLPLITSPEGKLLKMMVSVMVEDLDSRLDVNAVGNLQQQLATVAPQNNNDYSTQGDIPVGPGVGSAESSLRHLFNSDVDYLNFLRARYRSSVTTNVNFIAPGGDSFDDLRSQMNAAGNVITNLGTIDGSRGRRAVLRHSFMPSLPISTRGTSGVGLDQLGNPLLIHVPNLYVGAPALLPNGEGQDDPYEARWLSSSHRESAFTIAEWERVYRKHDWDRSMLPSRLEGFLPNGNDRVVSPRSSHLRLPSLAFSAQQNSANSTLYGLITAVARRRNLTIDTVDQFQQLFPMEFGTAQVMNVNRMFGNGIDDDNDGSIDEPEELLKNGIDDNNNGTIDELAEMFSNTVRPDLFQLGAPSSYPHGQRPVVPNPAGSNLTYAGQAANGFYPLEVPTLGIPGSFDPQYDAANLVQAWRYYGQQSRQLYARNIYCLGMLMFPDPLVVGSQGNTRQLTGAQRARTLAQWAVNTVDFRDTDTTITRFPYDPNPFTVKTVNNQQFYWLPNSDTNGSPNGCVVWGLEQPELLLTETFSTHDPRVKDTAEDSTQKTTSDPTNPDDDFDQYRKPEGSLFLEFLCPRTTFSANSNLVPGVGSLYTVNNNNVQLLLNALSPSDGTTRYPVWRVAFTQPDSQNSALRHYQDPSNRDYITYQLPNSSNDSLLSGLVYDERSVPGSAGTAMNPPTIDRLLWFVNPSAGVNIAAAAVGLPNSVTPNDLPSRVYWNVDNSGNPLTIGGGQYFVVGPRQVTNFGSKTSSGTSYQNEPNDHRIVLENSPANSTSSGLPGNQASIPSWASIYVSGQNGGTRVQKPNDGNAPPVFHARDTVCMVAVTDPPSTWGGMNSLSNIGLNLSEPHPAANGYYAEPTQQVNSNDNTGDPTNGAAGFSNLPKDGYRDYGAASTTDLPDQPFDARNNTPIQRFYEPTHPPAANWGVAAPGTQLDWSTAFLQRLADPDRPWDAVFNPYITVDWMTIDLTVFSGEAAAPGGTSYSFSPRQKQGSMVGQPNQIGTTFLSYDQTTPGQGNQSQGGSAYFDRELPVEDPNANYGTTPTTRGGNVSFSTLGYLNSPFQIRTNLQNLTSIFVGTPATAPANLLWLNRSFANPYEMLLVPYSAPGRLMTEFAVNNAGFNYNNQTTQAHPHPHLLNFFGPPSGPISVSPLAMFELLENPSEWSDAESLINADQVDATSVRQVIAMGVKLPPHNRISNYVEAGRVNMNTVSQESVWRGVEYGFLSGGDRPSASHTWQRLVVSRQGYLSPSTSAAIPNGNTNLDGKYPTEFAGVFKSPLAGSAFPATRDGVFAAQSTSLASLFRPVYDIQNQSIMNQAVFNPQSYPIEQVNNTFFQYLPVSRLANLTTQRSNVFGVWVTVGFFEYDPSTATRTEGGIGQEYGWDNGKSRRHRAFYLIDRSVPVAFQPGEDFNTEKCILSRRIIE